MSTRTELRPQFFEYDAHTGRPLRELTAADRIGAVLREGYMDTREQIMALPSVEDGLDLEAVDEYRQEMGAPEKPYRILSPEDYQKAHELVGKDRGHSNAGEYLHFGDVVIVRRDPEAEKQMGPGLTESLLVHELAHASNEWSHVKVEVSTQKKLFRSPKTTVEHAPARVGQVVMQGDDGEGTFLEEGYAEYERGRFIVNKLGLPNGFAKEPQTADLAQRMNKYVRLTQDNTGESFGAYGWAALSVELLAEYDPDLLQAFRDARHSAQGLRDVAQSVESVDPGLYRDLRKIDIHADGASQAAEAAFIRIYKALY